MCDNHDHGPVAARPGPFGGAVGGSVSRRGVLRGGGVAAAAAAALPVSTWGATSAAAATERPIRMGMHVHASFSEGAASMASQLYCARESGVDVVWFTEHDWRMQQHSYRTQVSFDSLTREEQFGGAWRWQQLVEGDPTSTSGGIVTSPISSGDPSKTPGALRAAVTASSTEPGALVWYANTGQSRANSSGNLAGTSLSIDVLPVRADRDTYAEIRIMLSNHPATGSLPQGQYLLSYRLGADGDSFADGFTGVVPVPVGPGRWTTVTIKPVDDIARLWPDLAATDNSLVDLWLGAVAGPDRSTEVVFDNLRFSRAQPTQLSPFGVQSSLLSRYRNDYPDIAAIAAQEVSFLPDHLNWFGGDDILLDYPDNLRNDDDSDATAVRARALLARGGMISINHPFGAEGDKTTTSHDTVADLAATYLARNAFGATMLEVAYAQRGGASLQQHLDLWDVLSRNGLYLTGTGVNDNHAAHATDASHLTWLEDTNRFTTTVTSRSTAQAALLGQLARGAAFSSELTAGDLSLSVSAPGVPMGSVSTATTGSSRSLTIEAAGLPAGSTVSVVQGGVDYAGTHDLSPGSTVVHQLPASALRSGTAKVGVDTRESSFVRTTVADADGRTIAVSNPVWLLRERSQTAVPKQRRAKG